MELLKLTVIFILLLHQIITVTSTFNFQEDKIKFYLWNKNTIEQEIHLNDYKNLTKAPTKFLIHGWMDSGTGATFFYYGPFVQKYISTGANVICVDWSYYSHQPYIVSLHSLKYTGGLIARMILNMRDKKGINLKQVHVIGHSLGAQMSGFVGKNVIQATKGKKIDRITGIDPAGPGFHDKPESEHLYINDADKVDTVVTDLAQYGPDKPLGQVNFYIYCGLNLLTIPFNHNFAPFYFNYGILKNDLIGHPDCKCTSFIMHSCKNDTFNILGEKTDFKKPGNYYLNIDPKKALEDAQCSMKTAPPSKIHLDFNLIKDIINVQYGISKECKNNTK